MILTTTDSIQGKNVSQYLGIVASVILTVMPGGNKMMGNAIDNFTKQAQVGRRCRYRIEICYAGQQFYAAWNRCEVKLMGVSL